MSPKRRLSENVSDSSDTDTEMPQLLPVARAPEEEAREPPTRAPSNWAEVEALGNETMEGLFEVAKQRPHLMGLLNRYLRGRHGVSIGGIGEDEDGVLTIVVHEKHPAPQRRCRWDGNLWTLSETLQWALMNEATLLWTLKYWERDFEP